jgi:hypothetical protein
MQGLEGWERAPLHGGGSILTPCLVVMVAWVIVILLSFGLFAPRTATALPTLIAWALAIWSAISLTLELDRPSNGTIQIPSAWLLNAPAQLGR